MDSKAPAAAAAPDQQSHQPLDVKETTDSSHASPQLPEHVFSDAPDLSALSFSEADNSDLFGSFADVDDAFGATSPMSKLEFGCGANSQPIGIVSEDNSEHDKNRKLTKLEQQKLSLLKQQDGLEGEEQDATRHELRLVEEQLKALEQPQVEDIFGGFSFDPSVYDQTAPTGFDGRHTLTNADEDDEGSVNDSLLKLPPPPELLGEPLAPGHEHEREVFGCRAIMYEFETKNTLAGVVRENIWFDFGRGKCCVYLHNDTGSRRLVFRQDATFKVRANFQLQGSHVARSDLNPCTILISQAKSLIVRPNVRAVYSSAYQPRMIAHNVALRFRDPAEVDRLLVLCREANDSQ